MHHHVNPREYCGATASLKRGHLASGLATCVVRARGVATGLRATWPVGRIRDFLLNPQKAQTTNLGKGELNSKGAAICDLTDGHVLYAWFNDCPRRLGVVLVRSLAVVDRRA